MNDAIEHTISFPYINDPGSTGVHIISFRNIKLIINKTSVRINLFKFFIYNSTTTQIQLLTYILYMLNQ